MITSRHSCYRVFTQTVLRSWRIGSHWSDESWHCLSGDNSLKFHMWSPPPMWKFETNRPVRECTTQHWGTIVHNAYRTVTCSPLLEKVWKSVWSDITHCRILCVCSISGWSVIFVACRIFLKSFWPHWKHAIYACRKKSTNKQWETPENCWFRNFASDSYM